MCSNHCLSYGYQFYRCFFVLLVLKIFFGNSLRGNISLRWKKIDIRHLGLYLKLTNSKSQVKSLRESHAKEMSLSLCGETTLLLYATSQKREVI